MKTSSIPTILFLFIITLGFNSCTKEAGIKEAPKLSAADCPRLASLTAEKKETLYTVSTFAGENYTTPDQPYSGDIVDGVLCKARFVRPYGIAIDPFGVIYIADQISNIRKIDTKGMVSVFAGTTDGGGFDNGEEDGIGTTARFFNPTKTVLDKGGNQFLIDASGISIRKITSTAQVSTFIGASRQTGYMDGPLSQARFGGYFLSIAITPNGFIYLYESNNIIRKIFTNGMVSTYAGQIPIDGEVQRGYRDGAKENALFGDITDMAFDSDENLYFCDPFNNKVRRINQAGLVETIADVTARSIAISEKGSVFVASGVEVFRIDPNGIVENIAGNEGIPAHKDGIGTEARFRSIKHMAIHKNYLYLTDGSTVRRMNIE